MYKQSVKQALGMLKENPFFSFISILGTALAISLIMVIVIIYELQTADYPPETNRSRTLFVCYNSFLRDNAGNYSSCGIPFVKACLYSLKTPEAVTAVSHTEATIVTSTDGARRMKCDLKKTDANYWKVFAFHFLSGYPFTQSDVESNIPSAVVSRKVARRLFGKEEVVGEQININRMPYRITGVVADVSILANFGYAQVWVPYPASLLSDKMDETTGDGFTDVFQVLLLAHSAADFSLIREEVESSVDRLNSGLREAKIDLMHQPDDQLKQSFRVWASNEPDMRQIYLQYGFAILILLLVPALNLSGLTTSRVQKRMAELGVRKAFGATRSKLVGQMLIENFVLTLIGGLVGLGLSMGVVAGMKDWLLGSNDSMLLGGEMSIGMGQMFTPVTFLFAFLFCLILNMLSAFIPAWRASSRPIVESLSEY